MTTYLDCETFLLVYAGAGEPQEQRPFTPAERQVLNHVHASGVLAAGLLALSVDMGLSYRYTRHLVHRLATRGMIRVSRGDRCRLVLECISREGVC